MSDNQNTENPAKTNRSEPEHGDKTVSGGPSTNKANQTADQGGQSANQGNQPANQDRQGAKQGDQMTGQSNKQNAKPANK